MAEDDENEHEYSEEGCGVDADGLTAAAAANATNGGPHGSTTSQMPNVKIWTFCGDAHKYQDWKCEVKAMQALYSATDMQLAGLIC